MLFAGDNLTVLRPANRINRSSRPRTALVISSKESASGPNCKPLANLRRQFVGVATFRIADSGCHCFTQRHSLRESKQQIVLQVSELMPPHNVVATQERDELRLRVWPLRLVASLPGGVEAADGMAKGEQL